MKRLKVLVVDDSEDVRHIFHTALSIAGYDVRDAADGLEALRRIDADPPDAIVLDLMMPYVSGFNVLNDLSMQAHTRQIPVIVVTGSPSGVDQLDVACLLRKPVLPDELVRAVARCLASGTSISAS